VSENIEKKNIFDNFHNFRKEMRIKRPGFQKFSFQRAELKRAVSFRTFAKFACRWSPKTFFCSPYYSEYSPSSQLANFVSFGMNQPNAFFF